MKFINYSIAALCLSAFLGSNYLNAESTAEPRALNFKIIAERTHKTSLFTQGLEVHQDIFYESSGLYHQSFVVSYPQAEPEAAWAKLSAPFTAKQNLADQFFAEGLTVWNQKIYVLTWREQQLFIYSAENFKFLSSIAYEGEGWGLTHDAHYLIRSDGTSNLFFHSPDDLKIRKILPISIKGNPVTSINELEYVDGFIYANLWQTNQIIKIDANSGVVVGILNLAYLTESLHLTDNNSVLNGIAYDEKRKGFWVTGKRWPKMFLLKIQ